MTRDEYRELKASSDDLRDEWEAKRASRGWRCQCIGMEMPGHCPGPKNCPMVGEDEQGEEE